MFFIYILYSHSADKYYVRYSGDVAKRVVEHNDLKKGKNTFTRKNGPWKLKAVFECSESEIDTITIERWIKNQKSRKLIEKIIAGEPLLGPLVKLVRVSI